MNWGAVWEDLDQTYRAPTTQEPMFIIYHIQTSPAHKKGKQLRQYSVLGHHITLQMVYFVDTPRQLPKAKNEMLNSAGTPPYQVTCDN